MKTEITEPKTKACTTGDERERKKKKKNKEQNLKRSN
jgi:hypothetical protein